MEATSSLFFPSGGQAMLTMIFYLLHQVEAKYETMQKEQSSMDEKVERAQKQVQRLSRELHRSCGSEEEAQAIERDFEVAERRHSMRAALHGLAELSTQYPGLGEELQNLLDSNGLQIPSRPSTGMSQRPSSRAGSMASFMSSSRGSRASSVVSSRASLASAASAKVKNVTLQL